MDRIDLAQDKDLWQVLVIKVMNLWVPLNVEHFLSSCTSSSLSRTELVGDFSL
jgi:hypothetical protein